MHYDLVPPHCVYTCTHAAGSAAVCVCGGGGGEGGCVCTHCGTPGVCDPRVVQWTQQTTTVGVQCSCSLFHLAVWLYRGGV